MVKTIDTPDGPTDFPDNMSDAAILEVLKKHYPPEKELSWSEVGTQADQSFANMADEFGRRLPFHIGERPKGKEAIPLLQTGADVAGGIGRTIINTTLHPIDTTVNLAKHVKHDFVQAIDDITGLTVGEIPYAEEANMLLGGKAGELAAMRRTVKKRLAEAPFSTALNMAAIPGAMAQIPRAAWRIAQAVEGGPAAAKILRAGRSPEAFEQALSDLDRQSGGGGATALDLMTPEQFATFSRRYFRDLTQTELAPLRERLRQRYEDRGRRQQDRVTSASGLPPGTLSRPDEYIAGVQDEIGQIENISRQGVDEAHRIDVQTAERQHADDLTALKAERDKLYPEAMAKGENVDMGDFRDILETPIVKDLYEGTTPGRHRYDDFSAGYEKSRGRGLGNLERLDRLEQELTDLADPRKGGGPGTINGRLAAEMAREIRSRLSTHVDPHIPEYPQARELHARVAETPEKAPRPEKGPAIPDDLRQTLDDMGITARERVRLSKQAALDDLMRGDPDLVRDISRADLNDMIMNEGVDAERTFERVRAGLPRGRQQSLEHWFRKWGVGGSTGGTAAFLFWLAQHAGISPSLLGTIGAAGTIGVGAKGLLGAVRRRKGRRAVNMLLGNERMSEAVGVEPFSWLDYINMAYPVIASGGQNIAPDQKEHH